MKRVIFAFALGMALMAGGATSALAELIEMKTHRDWVSGIIRFGEFSSSRMVTVTQEKDTLLIIDFAPGQCGAGVPRIAVIYKDAKKNSFREKWSGSARVDSKEIYETQFTVVPDDGSIVFYIDGVQGQSIFRDAIQGNVVRFKIEIPEKKPIYIKFSLVGFRAAYERAQSLCKIMKENSGNGDEKYFPKNEDEKYFKNDDKYDNKGTNSKKLNSTVERL